ncbi:MAG: hypothetical protein ACRDVM_00765, partial [Acidimicrobiia bacterium]
MLITFEDKAGLHTQWHNAQDRQASKRGIMEWIRVLLIFWLKHGDSLSSQITLTPAAKAELLRKTDPNNLLAPLSTVYTDRAAELGGR